MKFILPLLSMIIISMTGVSAQAEPTLVGEMQKLEVFSPRKMPEIMMDGLEEKKHFLSDYKGQVVLLNLWATWCPPCVAELASLDELEYKLGGYDFKVVALSLDEGMTTTDIADFLKEEGVESLDVYLDHKNSTSKIPGLAGLPTSFLLNANGSLVGVYQGDADWSSPEAVSVIQYYIDRQQTEGF